jgi:hypothetical protein
MTRGVRDELAQASGHVQESIGAIATVQAFAREDYEAKPAGFRNSGVRERSWTLSVSPKTCSQPMRHVQPVGSGGFSSSGQPLGWNEPVT